MTTRTKVPTFDPSAPLRSLRQIAGLTQARAAARLGIAQGSVSDAESLGDRTGWDTIRKYAAAYGLEIDVHATPSAAEAAAKATRAEQAKVGGAARKAAARSASVARRAATKDARAARRAQGSGQ
jgi:transcriptional regulator with XRE-family HTH domain